MGGKLKDYRSAKKISQEELASLSGVSRQTISAIENNGAESATTKTLAKIAQALGTTVSELFLEESSKVLDNRVEMNLN